MYTHKKTLLQKSEAPGWHHLWAAAMVMSDMPEDSTVRFACCPSAVKPLPPPDHSRGRGLLHHFLCEQKALCGVSSTDGLQGLQQTVWKLRELASEQKDQCLNKSCERGRAMTLIWVSNLPHSKFRLEILSVCNPSCQFLVKWVIDSGHLGLNHVKADHEWPLYNTNALQLPQSSFTAVWWW